MYNTPPLSTTQLKGALLSGPPEQTKFKTRIPLTSKLK
jgi:hypothetical protein